MSGKSRKARGVLNASGTRTTISSRAKRSLTAHFNVSVEDFGNIARKDAMDTQNSQVQDETTNLVDLTGSFKDASGVAKVYRQSSEQNLAKYAVTLFVNQFATMARDARNLANPPSTHSIETGVNATTTVFRDVTAEIVVKSSSGDKHHGVIQAVQLDEVYRVSLAAPNRISLGVIESEYRKVMEQHNFYQGQTLMFASEGVEFIPTPSTKMDDAILPKETLYEYDLNVIQFLTNPEMSEITKKRGIILHGAPGTGKTTSVKAMFRTLKEKKITCVHVSDASFSRYSVEDVFSFINQYLAPCLIAFEDIDLVAADRRTGNSRIIGPLLSAMNGIEETVKPTVILATTNRPEVLDAAITRPCRFDRKIKIDFPTTEELNIIFKKVAGFPAPEGLIQQASKEEKKLTGAHVEEIYRTAALTAKRRKCEVKDCVVEAIETVKKHFMLVSPKTVSGFANDDGGEAPQYAYPTAPGRLKNDDDVWK